MLSAQAAHWAVSEGELLNNAQLLAQPQEKVPVVHPPLPSDSGTSLASINTFLFSPLPFHMKWNQILSLPPGKE